MRRVLLGLLAALALLALAGGGLWYANVLQERAQAEALAEARARWEQRPFEHYDVQVTFARDTMHVRKFASTSRNIVGDLFDDIDAHSEIEKHYPSCRRQRLMLTCYRRINTYAVDVTYDPQLGYPRRIVYTTTAIPDWFNPRFWYLFVQHRWWNQCRTWNCTTTYRKVVTIDSLEPLPPDAD